MSMKTRIVLSIIILLSGCSLFALSNREDIYGREDIINKSFYDGDYIRLYRNIEKLLSDYPTQPLSVLYYRDLVRLADFQGTSRVEKTLRKLIGKIGSGRIDNLCALLLRQELVKLLYSSNRVIAENLIRGLRPVRAWKVFGPFVRYGKGDLDYRFGPELFSSKSELNERSKDIFIKSPDGYLKTSRYLYPSHGIVYASTSFSISKPVIVRIESDERYVVIINGKKVIINRGSSYRNLRLLKLNGADKYTLMLKVESSRSSRFRVIITDENNVPQKLSLNSDARYMKNFTFTPVNDYPYDDLMSEINRYAKGGGERGGKELYRFYRYLGAFFSEYESPRADEFYRESLKLKDDPVTEYFLASSMIENRGSEISSSRYLEGGRIIDKMSGKYNDFAPLLHRSFIRLYEGSNYLKAYRKGVDLVKRFGYYPDITINFLDLLKYLGYEKEYREVLDDFKKRFPDSIYILMAESKYWKKKDKKKYREILKSAVKRKNNRSILKKLIEASVSSGRYSEALEIIKNYDREEDFSLNSADILIEMGEYRRAKSFLFKEIVKNSRPSLYYRLGGIEYREKRDPLMFWEKMLDINPSLFTLSDYNRFLENGYFTNPFRRFYSQLEKGELNTEDLITGDLPEVKDLKKYPSTLLKRERVFILNNNRSSRVFCRDLIYLHNQKGIEKWGEYRVPYKGKIEPVRIRTYYTDGSFRDSYKIQNINERRFITLSGLKKGSVVNISYIVENPVKYPSGSHLFALPVEFLQTYEEPVLNTALRFIVPEETEINILLSDKWHVNSRSVPGKRIYSVNIDKLDAVYRESFTGSNQNLLEYFSFSSLKNREDFFNWYKGLLGSSDRLNRGGKIRSLRGGSIKETVINVYDFVSREITLKSGLLYYPEKADDILYRRSGTVEDKVILAKAILEKLGVKSYIAFTGRRYLPDYGDFVNPHLFTDILLNVPLNVNNSLWLDFSNMHYTAGNVNYSISGTESFVMLENSYILKKVESSKQGKFTGSYSLRIDENGNGKFRFTSGFSGLYGSVRKYFTNRMYNDDVMNNYLSSLIPQMSLNRFEITGMDDYSSPFKIEAEGEGFGIAITGAGRLYLHPVLNKSGIYKYIVNKTRRFPLFILTSINEDETYRYGLPDSYSRTRVNRNFSIRNSFGIAKLSIVKESNSRELIVKKRIKITRYRVNPDEYESFLKFCLELKNAEFQTLIIKKNDH